MVVVLNGKYENVNDVNHNDDDDDDDAEVNPSVYIPGVAEDLEWEAT